MRLLLALLSGLSLALAALPSSAAERARAAVACKATATKLVYACAITLRNARSGAPLVGADVTVGADMPSMPMAHNVSPAKGVAEGEPGRYAAELHLEMLGDWAVHVTVAGPLRDRIVTVLSFTEAGAESPKPKPKGSPHGPGHKGH